MTDESWLYVCITCGNRLTAGPGFQGSCPGCHGIRWLCHWLDKDTERAAPIVDKLPERTERGQDNLSPLKHTPVVVRTRDSERLTLSSTPGTSPGRKETLLPVDLISRLASQGLGCKAISTKLLEQGIVVSYRTIQRRLQADLL